LPGQGALYSWGYNSSGALGLGDSGNYTARSSPNQVGSLTTWYSITGGSQYSLATKSDGTLWVWGSNSGGQLGLNNTTEYSSPKQVGALTNWSSVSANTSANSSFAIKTNGTLWSWGGNFHGQLGLGTNSNYISSPSQVGSLTNWSSVLAGYAFTVATKTDGTLWSWGLNNSGQLGLGNQSKYSSPKQVGSLTNWLNVAGAGYTTLAVKTDGTLWSWGGNTDGQLGLGNRTNYSSPKQVGSLTDWLQVSGGQYGGVSCVKTDGTLWAWGTNAYGQLGLNNRTYYSSPKQVGSLTTWAKIRSGDGSWSLALKTDGTLWSWGNGGNGRLALGNTTSYSSPKQVGSATNWTNIAVGNNFGLANRL
jgi:alpha-tubulin suppressor-like RCC1 family protein